MHYVYPSTVPCMSVYDWIFWKDAQIIKRVIPLRNPPLQFCTRAKSPKYFKHPLPLSFCLYWRCFRQQRKCFGIYLCKFCTAGVIGITINRNMWKTWWRTSGPILILGIAGNCLAEESDWQSAVPMGRKRKFNCVDPYWWGLVMGWFVPV